MGKANAELMAQFPVHKEYPDTGYKWIELATPTTTTHLPEGYAIQKNAEHAYQLKAPDGREYMFTSESGASMYAREHAHVFGNAPNKEYARLEDALKNEGETMQHCVGSYCSDVASGKSRIYSLRDAKGEPHVTIEVQPNPYAPRWELVKQFMHEATEWAKQLPSGYTEKDITDRATELAKQSIPPRIMQIKGKQNRAPKAEYLPYVQDFVKSGNWGEVGDLHNSGLVDTATGITPAMRELLGDNPPKYIDHDEVVRLVKAAGAAPTRKAEGGRVKFANNINEMRAALALGN